MQVQQSALVWHPLRQKPSTQVLPLAHSALDRQLGCGRTSGWHSPAEHMSCAGQSVSAAHAPWQKPFTQVWFAGQSKLNTHERRPSSTAGNTRPCTRRPFRSQSMTYIPADKRRSGSARRPHSLLKRHSAGVPGSGWHDPETQQAPAPQSLVTVHAPPVVPPVPLMAPAPPVPLIAPARRCR